MPKCTEMVFGARVITQNREQLLYIKEGDLPWRWGGWSLWHSYLFSSKIQNLGLLFSGVVIFSIQATTLIESESERAAISAIAELLLTCQYVDPPYCPTEIYAGCVACCSSHSEYADGTDRQTDRQTDHYLCFSLDTASVIRYWPF